MKLDFGTLYGMGISELELLKSNIDGVIERKQAEEKVVVWQLVDNDSFVLYCSEDWGEVAEKVADEADRRIKERYPHEIRFSIEREWVPKSEVEYHVGDFR